MKKILTLTVFILTAAALYAQGGSALLIPSDSRSIAMGVSALQPGAATLAAEAFYGKWAPKTADNTLVGVNAFYRLNDKLSFTLEGRELIDKPYTVYSSQGVAQGPYTTKDLIFGLGGSYAITGNISAGLKARILSSGIAPEVKGSAFCVDLGASYSAELFTAGLSLKNLGSKIDFGAGGYALPAQVQSGPGRMPHLDIHRKRLRRAGGKDEGRGDEDKVSSHGIVLLQRFCGKVIFVRRGNPHVDEFPDH